MLRSKNVFRRIVGSTLIAASLLSLSMAFLSCDNFLEGSELTEELKEEIDYANAEEVIIRVAPRTSNHGDMITNGGEVKFKVGYPKTVEFNLKDNYEFTKWIVKDRSSKTEYAEVVKFTPLTEASSKVQKVEILLLRKVENLHIMPVCKVINDTVAPNISSDYKFALSKTQLGKQNDVLRKAYTSWKTDDYKTHHAKSVWLNFKITETDFENAEDYSLYVEEILLKDVSGNSPNSITQFNQKGLFKETASDGTFEINYEYPFTSGGNGIVQLNICAMDSRGNKSNAITCYVLKDTNISASIETKLYNSECNTYKKISQNVKNLSFTIKNLFDEYYSSNSLSLKTEPSAMKLTVKEKDNKFAISTVAHTTQTVNTNVALNMTDTSKNYTIIISIEDEAGNIQTQTVSRLASSANNFTYLYSQNTLQVINEDDEPLIIYYADFDPSLQANQDKTISHVVMENNVCTIQDVDLSNNKKIYLISQPVAIGGLAGSDGFLSKTVALSADDVTVSAADNDFEPSFTYEYESSGSGSASYIFTVKLDEDDLDMFDEMYAKGGFSRDLASEEIEDNYIASTVYSDEVYFTFETKYLAPKFDNDTTSTASRNLILIVGGIIEGEVYETKKVIPTNTLKIEDNIPPKVYVAGEENKKNTSERNVIRIRKPVDRSGIEEKSGQCSFDLMYFPEGQSQNGKTITVSYNPSSADDFITVRLPVLTNANYVLMPLVGDKKKNRIITESYTHLVNGGYFTTKPVVTHIAASGADPAVQKISMDLTGYTQYTDYSFTVEYFNPSQNKWVVKETAGDFTKTGNVLSREYTDLEDKFVRVSFYAWYSATGTEFGEDAVLIYAEPVVAFAGSGTTYSNNIYEGYGGLTIDCNSPCLVQTYCSDQNNGTSIENWETNCYSNKKINPKYFTQRGIYTINDTSMTKGSYYVVIAYYSDGSKILTNVRQKE